MTVQIPITLNVGTTDPNAALGVTVRLDNNTIFDSAHITKNTVVSFECSDDDNQHVLEIELYGKLPAHTQIDETGGIIKDAMLTVSEIYFDGIDLSQIFAVMAKYTHNFNGSGSVVTEQFYGNLGCNGVVRLEFTTPIYLWLLENM